MNGYLAIRRIEALTRFIISTITILFPLPVLRTCRLIISVNDTISDGSQINPSYKIILDQHNRYHSFSIDNVAK